MATKRFQFSVAFLEPIVHQQDVEGWGWQMLPDTGFGRMRMNQSARYFHEVGDALASLLVAFLGGQSAAMFFGGRNRPE